MGRNEIKTTLKQHNKQSIKEINRIIKNAVDQGAIIDWEGNIVPPYEREPVNMMTLSIIIKPLNADDIRKDERKRMSKAICRFVWGKWGEYNELK